MPHALGRVVEHDARSRQFSVRPVSEVRTVLWRHNAPVLDQGEVGGCTGFALAQCLNTEVFTHSRGAAGAYLTASNALALYEMATQLDDIPGSYPPIDTGSSGLAVCKAGVSQGYLRSYRHAFGFDQFLHAVQSGPVIVGTDWFSGMETPDGEFFVRPEGDLLGGHEYLVLGVNLAGQYVTILNSWSADWGSGGRARISFADFKTLLAREGDVTVPVGVGA